MTNTLTPTRYRVGIAFVTLAGWEYDEGFRDQEFDSLDSAEAAAEQLRELIAREIEGWDIEATVKAFNWSPEQRHWRKAADACAPEPAYNLAAARRLAQRAVRITTID